MSNYPPPEENRTQVTLLPDSLAPKTNVAVIEVFTVDSAREVAFLENAEAFAEVSRKVPGCNLYALCKVVRPGGAAGVEYLIQEDWQTFDLFRIHWLSTNREQFRKRVELLTVSPPKMRIYFGGREYKEDDSTTSTEGICSSALSFSWAMSLFGIQQMADLFSRSSSAQSLCKIRSAAEGELNKPFRAAFRAGHTIQKGIFDLSRDGFPRSLLNPDGWMRMFARVMQPCSAETIQQSSESAPVTEPPPRSGVQTVPETEPSRPQPRGCWGPMPVQVPSASSPASKSVPPPAGLLIPESNISPAFPFPSHYVDVFGSRMHYIEQGSGDVILLLHGNPSWSYCWRNIVPHLSSLGRCIAPDLIGYGRSDKPSLQYLWFDHVRYLETFISKMGLENITLVLHDQGSALGFHYAMRHQSNIKAIAFFEALVRPFTWDNFSTPEFRDLFRRFRTGGKGGLGWKLIVDQNMFIEQLLPQASGRPLTEAEMNYYRQPFSEPRSRLPIWQFPRQTAIGGEPSDVWQAVVEYSEQLKTSSIPKFMLYATPGALLTPEHVGWCQENLKNLKSVNIGPGLHFLEESSPHRIGREIASWIQEMPCISKGDSSE